MKILVASITILLTAASTLVTGNGVYATETASFSVIASPSSVTVDSNTTVSLYESGTDVNVVTSTFSYDSSKLQFISSSCAGNFANPVEANNSRISCYAAPGTTANGRQKFATITFKSITIGSAKVTVTGAHIASEGINIWDGKVASTTITISTAPTPTATPASTPTPTATVAPTVYPTQAANTTPTPSRAVAGKVASKVDKGSTNTSQVEGATTVAANTNPDAQLNSTPTPTASASATPTTTVQDQSESKWPWVAAGLVVIAAAAMGVYYWRRHHK